MLSLRSPAPVVALGAKALAALAVGLAAGVVGLVAVERLDVLYVLGPVILVAAWWLVQRPLACGVALLTATILFENDPQGFLPMTIAWYRTFGGLLTPTDALVALATAAVGLDHLRRPQPLRMPLPFVIPLLLLTVAAVAGTVTGFAAGASPVLLLNALGVLAYLVLVPIVAAHLLTTFDRVRATAVLIAALTIGKAGLGVFAVMIGQGRRVDGGAGPGGAVLTYYGPVTNLLTLVVLLAAIGFVASRMRSPLWLRVGAVLCVACLALSYRRSFWIATVVAAALVLVNASGRRGRPLVLAAAALVAGGLWFAVNVGDGTEESVITERVRSLDPDEIEANAVDRYRLDEQRNVFAEIERRPLTGIGLGKDWVARHPLPLENEGGRNYTHTTVLWYWLKLGPIGLVAYLALHAVAVAVGHRLWRRARDPVLRHGGLATAAGIVGLAIAETTGSFTGVEDRFTVVIAGAYGWLAAAASLVASGEDEVEQVGRG